MKFETWFKSFLEEKEVDMSFFVTAGDGSQLQVGDVCSAILSAAPQEQEKIKTTLVKIDFLNGDVYHYFKHLAQALTAKDAISVWGVL